MQRDVYKRQEDDNGHHRGQVQRAAHGAGQPVGELGQRFSLFMKELHQKEDHRADPQAQRLHEGKPRGKVPDPPLGGDFDEHVKRRGEGTGTENQHGDQNQEIRAQDAERCV